MDFTAMNFAAAKRILVVLVITGLSLAHTANAKEQAQHTPAVQTETLLSTSSSWDGVPYKAYPDGPPELTVLKLTIPPHTKLPWHTHPMPNVGYILSGKLTVEMKATGEKKVLTAGQPLAEVVDEMHRGISGDEPVVLIIFYAGTKGMPLVQH